MATKFVYKPEPYDADKVDVIIVGAGLSGLTSALRILQKERSLQIKILEASNEMGGKIGNSDLGEIGGKWITEDQVHINNLLQDLNIMTRRRTIITPNRKRCWDIDRGLFARFVRFECERYLQELELMSAFYKPGSFDMKQPSKSMHKHICNRLFFNKSRKFMKNLIQLICGVDSRDLSFVQFMSICYTCGGLKFLIDLYLQCPTTLIEIPSGKILEAFTEKLQLVQCLYWRKVYEIHQYRDYVEVRDSEFETHYADVVILAIPWNSVQEINIIPAVPVELCKVNLIEKKPRQMITSFIAEYNDGYWREAGYSGNFLVNSPHMIIGHEYRMQAYTGLMLHEEGMEQNVQTIVLKALSEYFGDEMLSPVTYTQYTYEQSALVNIPSTTPWNRVIWSSSAAAATSYRGCLGGAVQSGLRAAMNAMLLVRPQTVIWQDIAEIHRAENIIRTKASSFRLWLSTWNLYNVTFYTLFAYSVIVMLRHMTKSPVVS